MLCPYQTISRQQFANVRSELSTLDSRPNPMTRRTIETIAFFAALLIVGLALHAWIASRNEQQHLQSTLATQKKLLDAADARETDRNATLSSALAQIDALKRATQTPEQIVRDLPKYLSLPQPITLVGES